MIDQEQQRAEIHSTGTEHWGIMQRMISFTVLLITALFAFFSSLEKEYIYVKQEMNWQQAQKYCKEHYTDLASFNKLYDDELKTIGGKYGTYTWIGMYRDDLTTEWKLSGGESLLFKM
ncbi:unnamed protein product [Oncorhynchus mykiss]|uniref:C-type lectin domain-containing protein n=1 Tax=Oncorhynchus mykiss TaxID=8022 RepID=A0A060W4H3_ONCMY|nr:unnamed protein product [Oncorhynchus mykiss]